MFLVLAVALPLLAGIPLPPAPSSYVTDATGVIPDDREAALNGKLAEHARATSEQVLVYVDRRVPAGTTLEEMGAEAIRRWGVGDAAKDNGAILFVFVDDRASRIEVGYGFEHLLTDARSKQILVELRPSLQSGDVASAVELGTNAILAAIASTPVAYDTRAAVEARAAEIAAREEKMIIPAAIFGIFFFGFLFYMLYRVFIVGDWKLGGSSRGSSSSSASSSSSGFSGGGGSGGGGGASDRW